MGGKSLAHLNDEERVEHRRRIQMDNYNRSYRSTGWVERDAELSSDEHTPEHPSPAGPSPQALFDQVERKRPSRADEFGSRVRDDLNPEQELKF